MTFRTCYTSYSYCLCSYLSVPFLPFQYSNYVVYWFLGGCCNKVIHTGLAQNRNPSHCCGCQKSEIKVWAMLSEGTREGSVLDLSLSFWNPEASFGLQMVIFPPPLCVCQCPHFPTVFKKYQLYQIRAHSNDLTLT